MRTELKVSAEDTRSYERGANATRCLPNLTASEWCPPPLAAVYSHAAEQQTPAALSHAAKMRTAQKRIGMSFAERME
jgi:hypothetical protein